MRLLVATLIIFIIFSFKGNPRIMADTIVYNGRVFTVDNNFNIVEAFVITNGKIVETGTSDYILKKYIARQIINAKGKPVYPGFIDAHAHFWGYAVSLQQANLVGTKSWDEALVRLQEFVKRKNIKPGEAILGRGWDQNDWAVKEFPDREKLDQLFPDNPVILRRVDGHAVIANQRALDLGGVKAGQKINGGEIEVKNGRLTGMLVDNATGLAKAPDGQTPEKMMNALKEAQQKCFEVGLTTINDCGLDFDQVLFIDSLQRAGVINMRLFAMLSDKRSNYEFASKRGKIKTDKLSVRAFKVYADGALGSRGAALLDPYTDRPGWSGFLLSTKEHFDSVAEVIRKLGFQMCTHAIGDSGNRTMLKVYAKYLQGKNDLRWRIEHAQVINEKDFTWFGAYNIIPSIQPTHATSDMYWAGDRLGPKRIKGAYAYHQLLMQNGWAPLGTDFPVEDISPFKTFLAAVFRTDASGFPEGGFQISNSLTREETIKGMTIWAAKAGFLEKEVGSIESGKKADFIIIDKDLHAVTQNEILNTKVLSTWVGGKNVFERKE